MGRGLICLLLLGAGCATAQQCPPVPAGMTRVEGERFVLDFRTDPATIDVGRHFSVELRLCDKKGAQPVAGVRVDAHMPDHRHGMNYRARVKPAGDGRFVAEGLLFHMPGRWQFLFDIDAAGSVERLTRDHRLD